MAQDIRHVPHNLRAEMGKRGLTAQALSKASGVHWVQISRILNFHSEPVWDTIKKLAKVLEIQPEALLLEPVEKNSTAQA